MLGLQSELHPVLSQHWHLCPGDNQGAPCMPQLPWVLHPVASDALGAFQPCSADAVGWHSYWRGWQKPGQQITLVGTCCCSPVIIQASPPGSCWVLHPGSCWVRGWVIPRSSRKCQQLMKPGNNVVLVGSFSGSSHEKQQISSACICERAQTLCRRMKVLFLAPRPNCNPLNYAVFT